MISSFCVKLTNTQMPGRTTLLGASIDISKRWSNGVGFQSVQEFSILILHSQSFNWADKALLIPVMCSWPSDLSPSSDVVSSCLSINTESAFKSSFDSKATGTLRLISPEIEHVHNNVVETSP